MGILDKRKQKSDTYKKAREKALTGEGRGGAAHQPATEIPVASISPNPYQPRIAMEEGALEELAASIKAQGLMQPVVAVRKEDGTHVLVAGHRRLEAHKRLGKKLIKAIVMERDVDDRELAILALVENMLRKDLDVIEESHALAQAKEIVGDISKLAREIGMSRATLTKKIAILKLDPRIIEDIKANHTTKDYAALHMITTAPEERQWELYEGFLVNGREWLKNEIERMKAKKGPKVHKSPVAEYIPRKKFTIPARVVKKLDEKKMKELEEFLKKLVEG